MKGERERQFAYSAHIGTDEHGYVLDVVTTPGNVHDSQSFKPLYKKIVKRFKNQIDGIAVDSAYKTPAIVNMITGNKQIPFMPYKRPKTKKDFFKPYEFVYDKYYGNVICPNNKTMDYKRISRDGFYIFEANKADCQTCPLKSKCTEGKNKQYRLSIYYDQMEYVEDIRHTEYGRQCYKNRSKTVERIFGDFKEKHNGRYTHYRGIRKVSNEQLLVFAAMNMKKMAMYLGKIA